VHLSESSPGGGLKNGAASSRQVVCDIHVKTLARPIAGFRGLQNRSRRSAAISTMSLPERVIDPLASF
jgi:hypothetical protein